MTQTRCSIRSIFSLLASGATLLHAAEQPDEFFPIVPSDIEVSLFAREPLVRNPCAITFDTKGRLCVGMGPQYRNPRPDTPGDSVFILIDENGDGIADHRKEFATGFNCIQGFAWKGGQLWVANSPDLTVLRDLDGDDEADEYVRVYTDLGNLEHALHGLNWGPDGKLYMSKGNSKGLTEPPGRVAPKQFRELWGVDRAGLPDLPAPEVFTKQTYKRNYHDPDDDWGRQGGILRCDADGKNLEIVASGFRNPWDITFDDSFNWLGTDNDQTLGDKIFSPFFGAHFGWGHPWSFDWDGRNHLPTVPASGPLFEGSGAGVIFCGLERYPEPYRGIFLINDWLLRKVYIYRPSWSGALLLPEQTPFPTLASAGAGRTMSSSAGRKFDPVDIEIGPDEAIYISSWGREYGAQFKGAELANEGRIYRLWPKAAPPIKANISAQPISEVPTSLLIERLASHLPVWRADAQEELIRRKARTELLKALQTPGLPTRLETWALWTLGRMDSHDETINRLLLDSAVGAQSLNARIQSIRILGFQKKKAAALAQLLGDPSPRIRLEAVLAIRQARMENAAEALIQLASRESDRLVYYALWSALGEILSAEERTKLLAHPNTMVKRAALLSLLEKDEAPDDVLQRMAADPDRETALLARKRLRGKAQVVIRGRPLQAAAPKIVAAPSHPRTGALDQALAKLPAASAERGRNLFMNEEGAGCVACHRLEGKGNAFAPDLANIGARADARFVIQSIVDPSAAITEGFVAHQFTTNDGEEFAGILLAETGASVKLALANGESVTLPQALIKGRGTSRTSAMPSNYADLLDSGQLADLAAFLLRPPGAQNAFTVLRREGSFDILLNGASVASYVFEHPRLTRPAIVNLRTLSGIPVTREFPAPAKEDHQWLHPGIGLSFGWLDGHDYWRLNAPVKHSAFLIEPPSSGEAITWKVRNDYLSADKKTLVCHEETRFELSATPDGLVLRIRAEFFNPDRAFSFGDQEESGLCIRVPPAFSVAQGGTILNDRGEMNEAGTWGREFRWIDYSGKPANHSRAGILIIPDPNNPRPSWSHSRDYGVIVANPFPRQPQERREPFVKTPVPKGERFVLSFSLLAYETKP